MDIDPNDFLELMKNIAAQNENPVRVEQNLVQKDFAKDQETSRSCTVKLGDGNTYLQIDRPNNSEGSEAERQEILDLLSQLVESKKLYQQRFEIEEPRVGSKTGISEDPIHRIRGGENLGKSGPGPRAMADAKSAKVKSGVAKAWGQNPSQRSRPAGANHLGQHLQTGSAESGNGLFDRFSARPTPDPSNPGCAGGPRSITVLSSQKNQEGTALTKEQIRNLPDARDGFIDVEGHPKLTARYGQVKFKTPDHGKIHGLPTNENGKTPKTEENALALRDSLIDMPNRQNIIWFDDGGYQKGTERGYDSLNLYDEENGVIGVFKKQENGEYLFSTTCGVTDKEEAHLFESGGNFVTEKVLNNQKGLTKD